MSRKFHNDTYEDFEREKKNIPITSATDDTLDNDDGLIEINDTDETLHDHLFMIQANLRQYAKDMGLPLCEGLSIHRLSSFVRF